jgi:hypothetical protein
MHAPWFGSLRPTGYKVAARVSIVPRQRAPLGRVIPKVRRRALRVDDLMHVSEGRDEGMGHGAGGELPRGSN